ncbi:MAG: thioesterase family protein [Gammaproteobacteria bacterium]|jgi:acyl-CoA thioester hydrolase
MKHIDLSSCRQLSTCIIPIRWVDMDAYQHVNNARYFDYMAETRASYFAKILENKNTQYVLVHAECDFKKPLVYPKTIRVKQYFAEMSRTTFTLYYTFHDEQDDHALYAIGKGILVSIDAKTTRPVPVPDVVKNLLVL